MEVDEETTSIHLNESITETLINENSSTTDKQSQQNVTILTSEDKPEDSEAVVSPAAVSESPATLSGVIENSAVVESKEIDVPSDDVAEAECELTSSVNVDGEVTVEINEEDKNDGDNVNVELKDVKNVEKIAENVENVEGDEIMKKEQVVKEEIMVFDEEENDVVKEETITKIVETIDEKETVAEDEEKSLDNETENHCCRS